MDTSTNSVRLLQGFGRKEYEATTLPFLFKLGRMTGLTIAEAAGTLKTYISEVLDSLGEFSQERVLDRIRSSTVDRAEQQFCFLALTILVGVVHLYRVFRWVK